MNNIPKYQYVRKWLSVGIILLFVGVTIAPAIAQTTEKSQTSRGNWLYVGGSGPGNYTRIQDAINDSGTYDTIFVYNGTYYEQLRLNKPLRIIGESKNKTIINAKSPDAFLTIFDWSRITFSGFTLNDDLAAGWIFWSIDSCSNINITGNIIKTNHSPVIVFHGYKDVLIADNVITATNHTNIDLTGSVNCTLSNNVLSNCFIQATSGPHYIMNNRFIHGWIRLSNVGNSLVSYNTLDDTKQYALYLSGCSDCNISYNRIDNELNQTTTTISYGMFLRTTSHTTLTRNIIQGNTFGVFLWDSNRIDVNKNTFQKNKVQARFFDSSIHVNKWSQNYSGTCKTPPEGNHRYERNVPLLPKIFRL